jgi:hypothetical protein
MLSDWRLSGPGAQVSADMVGNLVTSLAAGGRA